VRSRDKHTFATQKRRLGLIVRTMGLIDARAKIGRANLAQNFPRLALAPRDEPRPRDRKAPGREAFQAEISRDQRPIAQSRPLA